MEYPDSWQKQKLQRNQSQKHTICIFEATKKYI